MPKFRGTTILPGNFSSTQWSKQGGAQAVPTRQSANILEAPACRLEKDEEHNEGLRHYVSGDHIDEKFTRRTSS